MLIIGGIGTVVAFTSSKEEAAKKQAALEAQQSAVAQELERMKHEFETARKKRRSFAARWGAPKKRRSGAP